MKELRYLNKYFIKYKYRLLLGIVITIASNLFAIQVPQLIRKSINVSVSDGMDIAMAKQQLLWNILLIFAMAILSGFFTFLMRQTIIVMSRLIEFDLKNEIYAQYQKLSLHFYKQNRTGDLMNRISEDVSQVRMYLGPAIMYSVNMLLLFIIAITKMFQIDTTLTIYTLLPLPILSISIYALSSAIHKRSSIVQKFLSQLTTNAQETFSGIGVLKSYGIEQRSIVDFQRLANQAKDKNIQLYKAQALFFPLMLLLIGISNIMVIYIGGMRYIEGQISLGVIAEFMIYVNMLTWPVAVVGWVTSIVQRAEASQKRINEFLKEQPEIINYQENTTEINGKIAFKNVSFTYADTGITALKNVSFTLEKGKTLAILGHTGSGKSTILELIARLYDTCEGAIEIDNKPLKNINLNNLRQHIGFVPQEALLFSDTIKNNIAFGKENTTENEIIRASKNAHIHHNIKQLSKGYDTMVGERGVMLSGGQKQRISIARAIIKNPKILLLDDCLSAVDTETEEIILQNLKKISADKTTIIVGHRISTAKNADTIIVLDKGQIVQSGTHQELIQQDGYYKYLSEQSIKEM